MTWSVPDRRITGPGARAGRVVRVAQEPPSTQIATTFATLGVYATANQPLWPQTQGEPDEIELAVYDTTIVTP